MLYIHEDLQHPEYEVKDVHVWGFKHPDYEVRDVHV